MPLFRVPSFGPACVLTAFLVVNVLAEKTTIDSRPIGYNCVFSA